MPYQVLIIRNSDELARMRTVETNWSHVDKSWWKHGNMSCDCNRYLEFERAGGDYPREECQCGHDAYSVPYALLPDGRKIAIDESMH